MKYLVHRLLLFIPTFFGMSVICFLIVNLAPGGPIERKIVEMRFGSAQMGSSLTDLSGQNNSQTTQEVIQSLKEKYGFDKPLLTRYWIWLKKIVTLDFGESFIYEEPAVDIIVSKLPVSLQFGILSFLLTYLISIPLGVLKAVRDGSSMDLWSSFILMMLYSMPPLILGIVLKTYFSGGVFVNWLPVGDLFSDSYFEKDFWGKFLDRAHHFVLPTICYTIGSFTVLTVLMKNSMMECIRQDYIRTAFAKGLTKQKIYLKHALKNALIPIVTGIGGFLQIFLAGSLIVEKIFNLDGIGLLGYQSAVERDFHVLLALLVIQAVLNIIGRLISDLSLCLVDPRITFMK